MKDQSSIMDAGELEAIIGNPWSVLPIKNNKYAKDLVEVHLSDRCLNQLEGFEQFPNLEVIWLNNNKVIYSFCANPLFCSYVTWTRFSITSV